MSLTISEIPIIDTDTHVVEPPDLWTSRVSSKWGDLVPHVEWDEAGRRRGMVHRDSSGWARWGRRRWPVGTSTRRSILAGSRTRIRWPGMRPDGRGLMDSYGMRAQVLYPNVAVFDAKSIVGMGDTELQLACIQAYNDFLVDFGNEQPRAGSSPVGVCRSGISSATLAEIERCAAMGHKGIVFTQDPSYFGLPQLTDRYWDPMWASAQEKGLPVNFHIASGDLDLFNVGHPDNGVHANYAAMGVSFFLANARTDRPAGDRRDLPSVPEPELRVGRERHRLDPLRARGARLAVAQLRGPQGAPRVRACCRASTSAARSTGASGSNATPPWPPSTRSVPTTSCTRPTSRTPRACRPGRPARRNAPTTTSATCSAAVDDATMRKILHDNAARIYHLD